MERFIGKDITEAYKKIESHATKTAAKDLHAFTIGKIKGEKYSSKEEEEKELNRPVYDIDITKPIVMQVYEKLNKEQYLHFIHDPKHMINPSTARLFKWDFVEFFSSCPYWVIPLVWIPIVSFHIYNALKMDDGSYPVLALFYIIGFLSWTFAEYILHRFLFHIDDKLPDNRVCLTLHFIFHGIHHAFPMDK